MDISNTIPPAVDPGSGVPVYLQIAEQIAKDIREGRIAPRTKLPPERQLALSCGVSRTTAINAYRKLEEWGLVRMRMGSGTYVDPDSGETEAPPMPWDQILVPRQRTPLSGILRELVSEDISGRTISLSTGMPDPSLYPTEAFTEMPGRWDPRAVSFDLGHIPTEGYPPLRKILAAHHERSGVATTANNIAVVSGSQQGLYLLADILIRPGDFVVVESPTFLGALPVFQAAGARILTLPAPGPLQLDLLEDYLVRYRPKLLYIMPSFQNPSGRVLTPAEREALLALAVRFRLAIIEDDPYGELYYGAPPPPSLWSLDRHDCVIRLGTFSKILFPGLRTGWVAGPEAVIDRLALKKQLVDLHSANLSQLQLAEFLAEGRLDDHLDSVRAEYRKRRDASASALRKWCAGLTFSEPSGGFYFWCSMKGRTASSRQLLQEAIRQGVSFVPGEAFYPNSEWSPEFRLCFAAHAENNLREGIRRLGKALSLMDRNATGLSRPALHSLQPII